MLARFLHLHLDTVKQYLVFLDLRVNTYSYGGDIVLSWTVAFLVLAVIAGVLGFGGVAGAAAGIAQVLFFVFLVLLVVGALASATRGRHG